MHGKFFSRIWILLGIFPMFVFSWLLYTQMYPNHDMSSTLFINGLKSSKEKP